MTMERFDVAAAFAQNAELAGLISGYRPREEQIEMASAVSEALHEEHALIVEAGTGVGKTLAYLLPVLAFGKKTMISTGTRHLQDQLYQKDLPMALKAIGRSERVYLLKGRSNYLCRHRYQDYVEDSLNLPTSTRMQAIEQWLTQTRHGDLAELDHQQAELLEDSDRLAITSTSENCLGSKCPEYQDCFVTKAREGARRADLVVTNHHLFAADLIMREDSLGELLPKFEVLVLDEAHRLIGVLEQFWSAQVSSLSIQTLLRDITALGRFNPDENRAIGALVRSLRQALNETLRRIQGLFTERLRNERVSPPENFAAQTAPLLERVEELQGVLKLRAPEVDTPEFDNALQRCERLSQALSDWPSDKPEVCEYLTCSKTGFALNSVPIDISEPFAKARSRYTPRWIYTSATLTVDCKFDYFMQKLGLQTSSAVETLQLDSPFDFHKQALLYLPPGLPEPQAPDYTEEMLEACLPLLQQLRGQTFMLFTSLKAMESAYQWLDSRLDCVLLQQGKGSRHALLERFTSTPHAILLGSVSFWEGVDIRGPSLSCVIIDKIPFESHRDLLYRMREKRIKEQNGNPFEQLQIPRAALMLKQGIGRLIRSVTDQGLVVIADPRLSTKGYGKTLLNSLPNMRQTKELSVASEFLSTLDL